MGLLISFVYWFFAGVLYFVLGVPYYLLTVTTSCLRTTISGEGDVLCRLVSLLCLEVLIRTCAVLVQSFNSHNCQDEDRTKLLEEEQSRLIQNSKLSQTTFHWKLQHCSEEKEYNETKIRLKQTMECRKKTRKDISQRFTKKHKVLQTEVDNKTKLLSNVKTKATNIALDTEYMLTQVKLGKAKLERLKADNERLIDEYGQMADQIHWEYSQTIPSDIDYEIFGFGNECVPVE